MNKLEYRMYGLVPYNLSPIQQGIQFGHAVVEYMVNNPMDTDVMDELGQWATEDKTFIILNGGTTNDNFSRLGSLNEHLSTLVNMGVKVATFHEPDLGDQLTAVVFLLDEGVWNEEKYPSPMHDFEWDYIDIIQKDIKLSIKFVEEKNFINRVEKMGGRNNWELRKFIKQFRLA